MGARRDGKASKEQPVERNHEWKAKANQAGDEIILNKHEVTDDSFLSYFNQKHFAEIFFSSNKPSKKVIFVQVQLNNDHRTAPGESGRSSRRFFCVLRFTLADVQTTEAQTFMRECS